MGIPALLRQACRHLAVLRQVDTMRCRALPLINGIQDEFAQEGAFLAAKCPCLSAMERVKDEAMFFKLGFKHYLFNKTFYDGGM